MIPIRDNIRRNRGAVIVVLLVLLCAIVFVREMQLMGGSRAHRIAEWYGVESPFDRLLARCALIPEKVAQGLLHPGELAADPLGAAQRWILPLFTSLFLHASASHLLSNLWFLWVFGRSVEARLGAARFTCIYFISGTAAGLMHVVALLYSGAVDDYAALHHAALHGAGDRLAVAANEFLPAYARLGPFLPSRVPTLGASGAISGILGAYAVTFPRARVMTIIPPLFFWPFAVPAVLFIALWLGSQMLGLWDSMAAPLFSDAGGVAYGAHFGGFVAGALLGLLLARPEPRDIERVEIR